MPTYQSLKAYIQGYFQWFQYKIKASKTIVVLGMHRSGTSFITHSLHLYGANLGDDLLKSKKANEAGHWESMEGIRINRQILHLSGGDWANPPERLISNWRVHWKIRFFLGKLHANSSISIWKDPRTVLTFPVWKPFLKKYIIVAIIRHPLSVARSLQKRNQFTLETGIDLWVNYNQKILKICECEQDVYWINFDGSMDHIHERIEELTRFLGMPAISIEQEPYRLELRHSDEMGILNADVQKLYSSLLAKTIEK